MSQMPDKIWLHKDTKYNTGDIVSAYQYEFAQEIECEGIENFVEYVPIDTFIEKACEWLKSNLYDYAVEDDKRNIVPFDNAIFHDFKKAMEE